MPDPTYLRDLISLAAGVLMLTGLLTLAVVVAIGPAAPPLAAGVALIAAGAGTLRMQNPRFPRRLDRR
jgi:hypothetical protein